MSDNYNFSTEKVAERSDMQVFAEKTRVFLVNAANKIKKSTFPIITQVLYKLSILKDIDDTASVQKDEEYNLRVANSSTHIKQAALLDMAVFTSPEFQDCIMEEKTLKEMVIEFQVVKSRIFFETRAANGTFIYEGALVEEITRNLDDMSSVLKKIYVDFFEQEVYPYHCSSILDLSFEDLFDQAWISKICEKLSGYNDVDILGAEYPAEVLNKFKFIYMLVKIQEIKYDSMIKANGRN